MLPKIVSEDQLPVLDGFKCRRCLCRGHCRYQSGLRPGWVLRRAVIMQSVKWILTADASAAFPCGDPRAGSYELRRRLDGGDSAPAQLPRGLFVTGEDEVLKIIML